MKKIFERTQENLDIVEPTKEFLNVTCKGHSDVLLNTLAYVGYIHYKYLGKGTGTYNQYIEEGSWEIIRVIEMFMGKPNLHDLSGKRYTIGIMSTDAITNALWGGRDNSSEMVSNLWRIRVSLEGYVEDKMGDKLKGLPYLPLSARKLADAQLMWKVARRRIDEIRNELTVE